MNFRISKADDCARGEGFMASTEVEIEDGENAATYEFDCQRETAGEAAAALYSELMQHAHALARMAAAIERMLPAIEGYSATETVEGPSEDPSNSSPEPENAANGLLARLTRGYRG